MKESSCDFDRKHFVELELDFDDFLTHLGAFLIMGLSPCFEVLLKVRLGLGDVFLDAVAL